MSERKRRQPRLRQANRVYVSFCSGPDGAALPAETISCAALDISAGGLCMSIHDQPAVGAVLDVRVVLRNPVRTFRRKATVMWVRPSQEDGGAFLVGVQFRDTPADIQQEWEGILNAKLTRRGILPDVPPAA